MNSGTLFSPGGFASGSRGVLADFLYVPFPPRSLCTRAEALFLANHEGSCVRKRVGSFATALAFFLIPTGDVIVGRIYFQYLCTKGSGARIYKPVQLEPEYWFPDGKPKFITLDGLADQKLLGNRYSFSSKSQEDYSLLFHIKKNAEVISEKQTGEILAEYIRFVHFGGWLANSTGLHVRGTGCPRIEEYDYRGFLKEVFRPIAHKK